MQLSWGFGTWFFGLDGIFLQQLLLLSENKLLHWILLRQLLRLVRTYYWIGSHLCLFLMFLNLNFRRSVWRFKKKESIVSLFINYLGFVIFWFNIFSKFSPTGMFSYFQYLYQQLHSKKFNAF